tara:strand:+ start:2753 stop:2956 length:204 start_codon:yes stop_codon:yes gene_type:complete
MTIPHAIFGGLALIALSIYFSVGSLNANASAGVQKIAICNKSGQNCAKIMPIFGGSLSVTESGAYGK